MNAILPELPRRLRDIDAAAERDLSRLAAIACPRRQNGDTPSEPVELINAASVKPEAIRWLWPDWLARGKLHVLAGAPGTGKTTIAMHFAACVSAGHALPSGFRPRSGHVLIWSGEDDPADTLVPRLIAAGADLDRVHFVGDAIEQGERRAFDPARDVSRLAAAIAKVGDIALLIVDPLVSAISGDSHKNAEVRRGLAPLIELASKLDAALLGITHFSKGTQTRDPLERVSGSLAFGAVARVVFGTVKQQVEVGQAQAMIFARMKSNIGPDGGGYAYTFDQVALPEHGTLRASRIAWGDEVEGTPRELLADPDGESSSGASESHECVDWLRQELADGPRDAAEMKREGGRLGYSPKVIRRAREKLGVKPRKEGGYFGAKDQRWVWTLTPEQADESAEGALVPPEGAQGAQSQEVGTFSGNGHLQAKAETVEL